MRGGPLRADMRAMEYLFEQGCSVSEVSKRLRICEEGLEPYYPKKKVTKKRVVKKRSS